MLKKDKFKTSIQSTVTAPPVPDIIPESRGVDQERQDGTRRIKNARLIDIEKIKPDPDQPRKTFSQESLTELSNSIREHGILQPITVEYIADEDYYKIISGERRYHASKLAELKTMPCMVYDDVTTKDRYAKQLIENIQREDFSPIDKARALLEYKDMLGPEAIWADVEKLVGLSERRRKQFVALLRLPEQIQKEIVIIGRRPAKNSITEKHARALLLLNSYPEKQIELFELIKNGDEPITGDDAINKAKQVKGKNSLHTFKATYRTDEELIQILEQALNKLKRIYAN
jgi:ParB family transcriptional regulator, chromosome partitioning protein